MGHGGNVTADRYNLRGNMPPAWLRNKVTTEQYDTLTMLNMIASVNYDLFKGYNTDKRDIDTIMAQVPKAIDRFMNDTAFNKRTDNIFRAAVYSLTPKLISWQNVSKTTAEARYLLYSSMDGYDAHVVLTGTLHKDKKTGSYTSSQYKIEGYSMGGAKVDCHLTVIDLRTRASDECKQITIGKGKAASSITITGSIDFTDPLGNKHHEPIDRNLLFELQP